MSPLVLPFGFLSKPETENGISPWVCNLEHWTPTEIIQQCLSSRNVIFLLHIAPHYSKAGTHRFGRLPQQFHEFVLFGFV